MILDCREYTNIGGRDENQDVAAMFDGCQSDAAMDENRLTALVEAANEAILQVQKEQFCSCKSTVVALSVEGGRAVWAHTGDSRLYRIHNGQLRQLTDDHSVAYLKYKTGEITKEQIPTDEDQSVLLRALGGYRWEPATGAASDLTPGDAFLLCSDGFWELVGENEMLADRMAAAGADEWAEKMLRRAAEVMSRRKGCDNLSVITVILA